MKLSKYIQYVEIDDETKMIYSYKNRSYYIYDIKNDKQIKELTQNLNKGEYKKSEIDIIRHLMNKGIVLKDEHNELDELEYKENRVKYNSNVLQIMVILTNDCNFRCTYCIQNHEKKYLDNLSEKKIVRFIEKKMDNHKKISICWFGGEPLIKMDSISRMYERLEETAKKKGCSIVSQITTNGYLLTDKNIRKIKGMNTRALQITIDGDKESHNKTRPLLGGKGTYDIVIKNLLNAAKQGLHIDLRINVDNNNIGNVEGMLYEIPEEERKNITVTVSNLYQTEDKLSTFHIYETAIKLGYQFSERKNLFHACEVCVAHGYIIDSEAKYIICANDDDKHVLGKIEENGDLNISNISLVYKIKNTSTLKNESCRECKRLPLCIGTCKKARYKNNVGCINKDLPSGLTIEEMAKLDYLYDMRMEE